MDAHRVRTVSTLYRDCAVHGHPDAGALVVEGSEVVWIGPATEASRHADGADEVVSLDGGLVTPAFVDAHAHLTQTGAGLRGVELAAASSAEDALLRVEAAVRAGRGRPVYAQNWDEEGWPGGRVMTARELDRASAGGVVYCLRVDGHSAVVSSALAASSGADRLPGWLGDGRVTREAHHAARAAFNDLVTPTQRREDIELALRSAAAAGIGTVHENGGPHVSSADDLADVLAAGARPDLPDTVGYWGELVADGSRARELARLHGVTGLAGDLNVDGSVGSRTASLRAPYADAPGHRGNAYLEADQVRDHVAACARAGLQSGFHVIGDAAADVVVEGVVAAAALVGAETVRRSRVRLEHLEMVTEAELAPLGDLGVVASVQPAFDAAWGGPDGMYAARLGWRSAGMNPYRTMQRCGLRLALGSDSPVTPFAPWEAVRACLEHHDEHESLDLEAAFSAHTVGGCAAARDDSGGRIAVGSRATLAVWEGTEVEHGLPVLDGGWAPVCTRTLVRGATVHVLG